MLALRPDGRTNAINRHEPIAIVALLLHIRGGIVGRLRSTSAAVGDVQELEEPMLETIAIILIVLWLLGVVSGYTLGNFIYVLLVIAIVLFLVRLISGRRVV
jgi:hypothetical protein